MVFTSEEIAMIDGIIETLFSGANVSADVRDAYLLVHRHLTEDALEVKDFKRIANAMEFAMKNQFCDSCSRESQRVLTSVLIDLNILPYTIEVLNGRISRYFHCKSTDGACSRNHQGDTGTNDFFHVRCVLRFIMIIPATTIAAEMR